MSDVKRLLDEASPLPWTQDEFDLYLTDADGEPVHWDLEGLGATWGKDANPDLILHAVNRLPDYEAAVDALEGVLPFVGMSLSISGHDVECTLNPCSCGVIEKYNAASDALRRLREQVPA